MTAGCDTCVKSKQVPVIVTCPAGPTFFLTLGGNSFLRNFTFGLWLKKIEFQSKTFKSNHCWCQSIFPTEALYDRKILSVQTLTFKCQRDIWTQKSKHMFSLICKFGILLAWDRVGISGRADESSFCLFYKHQCLDDWFSWQEGEGGGNKNGQQKKGAGIKRQRGWNDCKKYQLYEEGCETLNTVT